MTVKLPNSRGPKKQAAPGTSFDSHAEMISYFLN